MSKSYHRRTVTAREGLTKLRLDQKLYACWLLLTGHHPDHVCERYGIDRRDLAELCRRYEVKIGPHARGGQKVAQGG